MTGRTQLRVKDDVVPIPAVGQGVAVDGLAADGASTSVSIVNTGDGLTVETDGAALQAAVALASPSACSDSANNWSGHRNNGWNYRVNPAPRSSGVSSTDFQAEIAFAESALESGRNDCGLAEGASRFSAEMTRGPDLTAPAMTSTGGCLQDNLQIIDFGGLSVANRIAQTCTWWTVLPFVDDRIYEADTRLLNSAIWYRFIPSSCSGKYEMAGALLHEFGHAFGFSHVAESTHANLTMSELSTPCSYADDTFGLGDYNMLDTHY